MVGGGRGGREGRARQGCPRDRGMEGRRCEGREGVRQRSEGYREGTGRGPGTVQWKVYEGVGQGKGGGMGQGGRMEEAIGCRRG